MTLEPVYIGVPSHCGSKAIRKMKATYIVKVINDNSQAKRLRFHQFLETWIIFNLLINAVIHQSLSFEASIKFAAYIGGTIYDGVCIDCFSSSNFSTTLGSASVEVSPKLLVSPVAILRKIRRMILPERVLGNESVQCKISGVASGPISLRTQLRTSVYNSGVGSSP